ncbi:GNAT family N-acetyltransferase [Novosphingobium sp.]|uniref:GNAT family N-acetyltransferase n=1 Tax=Novosphingobium sp. TaxID=1874826 RepID=UPI0025DEBA2F|nr:GNAT family N-acetyltransferase [Novosphingobium sp.]
MAPSTYRIATIDDLPALRHVIARAIAELQADFLTPAQVAASALTMGLDTQLIRDGTYFIIERDAQIAGCGGWSFRSTLYGGDDSIVTREPEQLNPATDAARVRAMYTHPDHTRCGIGRQILGLCEEAARAAGFHKTEMMATLAGEPLYRACGYLPIEQVMSAPIDGISVPLIRMGKQLTA